MIRNQTDYRKAMCKMIRKIQNSSSAEEINDLEMSIEDAEILNDCIENGFVRGKLHIEITMEKRLNFGLWMEKHIQRFSTQ